MISQETHYNVIIILSAIVEYIEIKCNYSNFLTDITYGWPSYFVYDHNFILYA